MHYTVRHLRQFGSTNAIAILAAEIDRSAVRLDQADTPARRKQWRARILVLQARIVEFLESEPVSE